MDSKGSLMAVFGRFGIWFTMCLSTFFLSYNASANVKLSHQAVNVVLGETSPVLTVKSDSSIPQVITTKITDLAGEDSSQFIVIPALAKLDPGQEVVFRVLPRDASAIADKGAFMERFIITTIPGRKRSKKDIEPGSASAQLNINLAYNLPLVYHGKSMLQEPWEQLELVTDGDDIVLKNPTDAVVRLSAIKSLADDELSNLPYNYIAPQSQVVIPGNPNAVKIRPINFYGFMLEERTLTH